MSQLNGSSSLRVNPLFIGLEIPQKVDEQQPASCLPEVELSNGASESKLDEGHIEMHSIDVEEAQGSSYEEARVPSQSSRRTAQTAYGGKSLVASLLRTTRTFKAILLPAEHKKQRRERARARWRMLRDAYVPSIARHQSMQVFQEMVRLAFEKLSPERFQEALQGPELEELKAGESTLFMDDEPWPLLLRIPVQSFGICMGIGSQAVLWKNLATAPSMQWAHIPREINEALWIVAAVVLAFFCVVYLLKALFWTGFVLREMEHPVRSNFVFAPFIAALFLGLALPQKVAKRTSFAYFLVPMIPLTLLMIRRYGTWLLGSKERLSQVANPTSLISVLPSFVGASLAMSCGWREVAVAFWAIGLTHWVVVFITLYQQLPSTTTVSEELHPVYFLFMAIPFQASVTWRLIQHGKADDISKGFFWLGCFMYLTLLSMVVKFNVKFSLAWWAYTFPMTAAGNAGIGYASAVSGWFPKALGLGLSIVSSLTVVLILLTTVRLTYQGTVFGKDPAIAITSEKLGGALKPRKRKYKSKEVAYPSSVGLKTS